MSIKTKVCEIYAVDVTIDHDADEFDKASATITRIRNVDSHELQSLIDAAPDSHKKVLMRGVSLNDDDKLTLTLDWHGE